MLLHWQPPNLSVFKIKKADIKKKKDWLFGCTGSWWQHAGSSAFIVAMLDCLAAACGILVPGAGIKPMPPALGTRRLGHWPTQGGPQKRLDLVHISVFCWWGKPRFLQSCPRWWHRRSRLFHHHHRITSPLGPSQNPYLDVLPSVATNKAPYGKRSAQAWVPQWPQR